MISSVLQYKACYDSPIGLIEVKASNQGITSVFFVEKKTEETNKNKIIDDCLSQLDQYFAKKRKNFEIPLDITGTDFQKKVWSELLKTPFGKTFSYLDIAIALGDKNSIRAVGNANGKNPIAIIVPCHRVIGADGKLVGYAGGIERKRWLLEFEGATADLFSK